MRIALFIPCYVNQFYPQVGIATYELLTKLGCLPDVPLGQTCCGQPMANSGFESNAKDTYHHFVSTFSGYDYIVAPSASCVYHVRKHYDIIPQSQEVLDIRERTLDLTEFLHDVLKVEALEARFPYKVSIHQSCHGLRGLRLAQGSERTVPVYSKWEDLLIKVKDIQLVHTSLPDECCGFGGTFAVTEEALSVKMGKDKITDSIQSNASYITSGDMSCLMHLDGIIRRNNYPVKVIHMAEILNAGL
ncbi:MAG: (Fe-S)-binding protein [Saprospiraceae bacterium]